MIKLIIHYIVKCKIIFNINVMLLLTNLVDRKIISVFCIIIKNSCITLLKSDQNLNLKKILKPEISTF